MSDADINPEVELNAKLGELFPPDEPRSQWLVRLMIIRDDLEYDFSNLWLKDGDGTDELWRCSYSLRRIAISISEARAIFDYDVAKWMANSDDPVVNLFKPALLETMDLVRRAAEVVKPIRDALSAHIRPQYADPATEALTAQVLRANADVEGRVRINFSDIRKTSYRSITLNALAFAWPKVQTDEDLRNQHDALYNSATSMVAELLHAIDALLAHHWISLGILKPDDDHDFVVPDPKTGEPIRLRLVPKN